TMTEEELGGNRRDFYEDCWKNPLASDEYWRSRMPDWSKVKAPLLSSANWGGQGLHPRGNFEGFMRAASTQKWLEVHGLEHWTHFYTDYGRTLQRRFFDHFLKGAVNGWEDQPRVLLQIRDPDRFGERGADAWPIAGTRWTRWYLDARAGALSPAPVAEAGSVVYDAAGSGVTFCTPPLQNATEITGPVAVKLHLSSARSDTDVFAVLSAFD